MNKIGELIRSFEKEIRIQHEAALIGDYKLNNHSIKKIHKIFKKLRKLNKVEELLPLLNSEHPEIRLMSAVYCLPVAEKECLKTLEEVKDRHYQTLSLGAEYAIKNWISQKYYLWD